MLDFPISITDRPGAIDLVNPKGRVAFEHVWFRHPPAALASLASLEENHARSAGNDPSAWILRDVSFTIEPGELVALVGPSGAGKTTTAMLVPRIYDTTRGPGHVRRPRCPRPHPESSLRDAVGIVMQDPHLFHESIRENLRYAPSRRHRRRARSPRVAPHESTM